MRLKDYLKGLGTGIFIAAVLMGTVTSKNIKPMTDEEIKSRAEELGMVEESRVLAPTKNDSKEDTEISERKESKENIDKEDVSVTNDVEKEITDGNKDDPASVSEVEPVKESMGTGSEELPELSNTEEVVEEEQHGTFVLEIASGTSSYSVAKLLEKGKVIEDAEAFDTYLCDNNYDNKINHGIFKIPENSDYEQIAKIITGGR